MTNAKLSHKHDVWQRNDKKLEGTAAMVSYRTAQKIALWAAYSLHLFILPSLIGLVINYRKCKQYRGIEYEDDSDYTIPVSVFFTHHLWLMRSFAILLVFIALSFIAYGLGLEIDLYVVVLFGLWWFVRISRGMIYFLINKPMPNYAQSPAIETA